MRQHISAQLMLDLIWFVRIIQACRHPEPWLQSNKSSTDFHLFGWERLSWVRWPILSLCLSVGPLFCLLQKRGENGEKKTVPCFSCWYVVLTRKICPFFSWLKTGTGAQSPRSCTVAFGSATGKGGSCEASVATQGAVDPLVGPHRCQRGYSKTVLTAMVCFLQFPQMDG